MPDHDVAEDAVAAGSHPGDPIGVQGGSDAPFGWHECDQGVAHLPDQPQVVPGEVGVEQRHRGGEGQGAGAAELEELHRHLGGQREGLGQVQPPPLGAEGVLVQAGQVLAELLGAGQAAPVGLRPGRGQLRGGLPVVIADQGPRELGPLEGQLRLGQPRGGGGLLQEVPVHPAQGAAQPLEQVGVGEPGR